MYKVSYRRRTGDKPASKFARLAAIIGLILFLAMSAWAGFAVTLHADRMDGRAAVRI